MGRYDYPIPGPTRWEYSHRLLSNVCRPRSGIKKFKDYYPAIHRAVSVTYALPLPLPRNWSRRSIVRWRPVQSYCGSLSLVLFKELFFASFWQQKEVGLNTIVYFFCFFLKAKRSRFFVSFCRKQKEISLVLSKSKEQYWSSVPLVSLWFFLEMQKEQEKKSHKGSRVSGYSTTHTEYLCSFSSVSPKSRPLAVIMRAHLSTLPRTRS